MRPLVLIAVAGCSATPLDVRAQRVIEALAVDNYAWSLREPAVVEMKLRKMQRGPYEWLRGTAGVYWRDVYEPGVPRHATAFGDEASSRVLLVGDPHPENVGTYRTADGTLVVEWNDFDAAGYGPYEGDLRRLAAGLAIAANDDALAGELARRAADGYATEIALLATGAPGAPTVHGLDPVLDKLIDKARANGDAGKALSEIAPVGTDGARQIAFGDLEAVAPDGVVENRQQPVGPDGLVWIDRALAGWQAARPEAGAIKLRTRRIGSGVASYPALRYYVVLEGPTPDAADDLVLELKETRDGVIIPGVPQREAAEWSSPAARVVDAQRRLHARRDSDALLDSAELGGLSVKIRDRSAYQRGLDASDLADLAAGSASDRDKLLALAGHLGALLARAHGAALTSDGIPGWQAISPLLAGREPAFVDEVAAMAADDVAQLVADHAALQSVDLGALVIPVKQ
jgi:uncharacterized protein (DUF2252 family)